MLMPLSLLWTVLIDEYTIVRAVWGDRELLKVFELSGIPVIPVRLSSFQNTVEHAATQRCHNEQKNSKCKKAAKCKTKLKKQAQKQKKSKKAAKKSQGKYPLSTLEKASNETGQFSTQNDHSANIPGETHVRPTNRLDQDLKSGPALWKYMNDEETPIGTVIELVLTHLTDKDTTTVAEGIDRIRRASCGAGEQNGLKSHVKVQRFDAVSRAGGVQAILTVMRAFPDDFNLQFECAVALSTMLKSHLAEARCPKQQGKSNKTVPPALLSQTCTVIFAVSNLLIIHTHYLTQSICLTYAPAI